MGKFITHEAVAAGVFSQSYAPPMDGPWAPLLSNESEGVMEYFLLRLEGDYETLHVKQRKAYSGKDLEPRLPCKFASCVTCSVWRVSATLQFCLEI